MIWGYGILLCLSLFLPLYVSYLAIAVYCDRFDNTLTNKLRSSKYEFFTYIENYDLPNFLIILLSGLIICLIWPITLLAAFLYLLILPRCFAVLNYINSMMEKKDDMEDHSRI